MENEVILHMLCQAHIMNRGVGSTVGNVARWMNVSKPTAQKRLETLVRREWVTMKEKSWRKNAFCFLYSPTREAMEKYHRGDFRALYDKWAKEEARKSFIAVQRTLI